jgi:hypothetical protein
VGSTFCREYDIVHQNFKKAKNVLSTKCMVSPLPYTKTNSILSTLKEVIAMTSWTKNNIPDLNEKVFIVTDANSGLGYETRLALTARPDALSAIADQDCDAELSARPL